MFGSATFVVIEDVLGIYFTNMVLCLPKSTIEGLEKRLM